MSAKPKQRPLPPTKLKSDSFISIFYEPLKTSAVDILSMAEDRANGGRAPFHMLITF
jgi:hypothetical protein